jgi:hypothetical protein
MSTYSVELELLHPFYEGFNVIPSTREHLSGPQEAMAAVAFYNTQQHKQLPLIFDPTDQDWSLLDSEIHVGSLVPLRNISTRAAHEFFHHNLLFDLYGLTKTEQLITLLVPGIDGSKQQYLIPGSQLGARDLDNPQASMPPWIMDPKNREEILYYYQVDEDTRDLVRSQRDMWVDVKVAKLARLNGLYRTPKEITEGVSSAKIFADQLADEVDRANFPKDPKALNPKGLTNRDMVRLLARFAALAHSSTVILPDGPDISYLGRKLDDYARVRYGVNTKEYRAYRALTDELTHYAECCYAPFGASNHLLQHIHDTDPRLRISASLSMGEGKDLQHLRPLTNAMKQEELPHAQGWMRTAVQEIACAHFNTKEGFEAIKYLIRTGSIDQERQLLHFFSTLTDPVDIEHAITLLPYVRLADTRSTLVTLGQKDPYTIKLRILDLAELEYAPKIEEMSALALSSDIHKQDGASEVLVQIASEMRDCARDMAVKFMQDSRPQNRLIGLHTLSRIGKDNPQSAVFELRRHIKRNSSAIFDVISAIADVGKNARQEYGSVPPSVFDGLTLLANQYANNPIIKLWILNHVVGLSTIERTQADAVFLQIYHDLQPQLSTILGSQLNEANTLRVRLSYGGVLAKLYVDDCLTKEKFEQLLKVTLNTKELQPYSGTIYSWIARTNPGKALDIIEYDVQQFYEAKKLYRWFEPYELIAKTAEAIAIAGASEKHTIRAFRTAMNIIQLTTKGDTSALPLVQRLHVFSKYYPDEAFNMVKLFSMDPCPEIKAAATRQLPYFFEKNPTTTMVYLENLIADPETIVQRSVIIAFNQIAERYPFKVLKYFNASIDRHLKSEHPDHKKMPILFHGLQRLVKLHPMWATAALNRMETIMQEDQECTAEAIRCIGKIGYLKPEEALRILRPFLEKKEYAKHAAQAVKCFATPRQLQQFINNPRVDQEARLFLRQKLLTVVR